MNTEKIALSYRSDNKVISKIDPLKSYLATDSGNGGAIRALLVFEIENPFSDVEFLLDEISTYPKLNLFFSQKKHYYFIRFLIYKALKKNLRLYGELSLEEKKNLQKIVDKNLAGVFEKNTSLDKIMGDFYEMVDYEDTFLDRAENLISSVWGIGYLQRVLMNSFVLLSYDSSPENFLHSLSHSLGYSLSDVKAYIKLLLPKHVVNIDGKLRSDNGAFEKVGERLDKEYGLFQKIDLDGNSITGIEYLHLSHYSKEKNRYLSATQKFFETFLSPQIVNYSVSNDLAHTFVISLNDQWRIHVFCDAHQRAVNDKDVGDVAMLALHNMKSEKKYLRDYYLICGPSFNSKAVDKALDTGIYFVDAFSVLKLASIFSKLSQSKKNQISAKFDVMFSSAGGFLSVGENSKMLLE